MEDLTLIGESVTDRREATRKQMWRPAREDEVKFYVDAPFTRELVTEEKGAEAKSGDILTNGYASTWVKDRDEEFVHPNAFDDTLAPFLGKNPMMLWQHHMDWPLGKYTGGETDQFGLKTQGLIPKVQDREPDWKHLAYHSVERGIVKTHSIGGYFTRRYDPEMDKLWIFKVDLMEISVVSIPANPESIFEAAVKSVKQVSSRPQIVQSHIDQMMQILGAAEMTHPELLAMSEKQRIGRYTELAAFYKKCGRIAPSYEEWNELAKEVFSAKGLEAVRGGGTKVVSFLRKVQGHVAPDASVEFVGLKKGRALSQKNEDNLRQAITLLDDVLSSVGSDPEADEQE